VIRPEFLSILIAGQGEPVFQEARAPTTVELQGLLAKIITRLMKMLTRHGYLVEEQGMTYMADIDLDNPLKPSRLLHVSNRRWAARRTQGAELVNHLPSRRTRHASTVRQCARLEPARGGALWRRSARATRTPVPLYHAPRHCQRTAQA
jgi:hypothetical protein